MSAGSCAGAPKHHLRGDTKDLIRLGTGLIGTIAALVLGLLVASAKSSFDTRNVQVKELIANVILLDSSRFSNMDRTSSRRQYSCAARS